MKKLAHFIETYDSAFIVGNYPPTEIIYYNDTAATSYGIAGRFDIETFDTIFHDKDYMIQEKIESGYLDNGYLFIDNVLTKKSNGETQLTDVRVGYFDKAKTEVFIEITPKTETLFDMAIIQVNTSKRPEAILNIDDKLSIIHCNDPFHKVFDSNEELRHSHFQNDLVNGFLPESRQELINDILKTLETEPTFSTKIKVFSATGEEKWYLFELEKRALDNSGNDKIMAYMTNIEKQVELEEEAKINNNFLKSVYSLIDGVWYIIDVKTKTLYHMLNYEGVFDIDNAEETKIADYINFLINEDVVHPDDQDIYRENAENFLKGINDECVVRFSFYNYNYKWYKVKGNHIYNDNGELVQIIGLLENVDQEQKLKEDYNYVNQLLKAIQSFTNDIAYVIDIKTMALQHLIPENLLNDKMKSFGTEIPDYVNNLINKNIIHPDDHEIYQQFAKENFKGNRRECIVRFSITSDEYAWYTIKGYNIYNESGKISKIIGTLVNIDEERKVKEDNSLLNQYFSIMQETTTDILYRVDVETMTLYHFSNINNEFFSNKAIPNYVHTFIEEKIIHPDDKDLYLKGLEEFNNTNETPETPIRFSIDGGEYKWFKVTGKKIFDNKGNLIETFGALVNVDNEHKIQEKADTLNNYFGALELISGESFYIIDVKTKVLTQKGRVAEELEIYDDVPNFPESVFDIIHPDDLQEFKDYTDNSMNGIPSQVQMRVLTPKGEYNWFELYSQVIRNSKGEVSEIFGKMNNIHKEKLMSADYTSLNQYFIALQELTEDKIFHIDIKNREFNYTNSLNKNITIKFDNKKLVKQFIKKGILLKEDSEMHQKYFEDMIAGSGENERKIQAKFGGKELQWYIIKTKLIKNDDGIPIEIFGKLENIQEKLDLEKKANFDKLTGTLSRETFEELVINDLSNPKENECNALIFIDIDDFKFINDNYGHKYGDFILQKFAERVENCIKKTDFLGRVGGDEFVVYLKDIDTSEKALERANTFIERMSRPISNGIISHKLGLSIGISITPQHGNDLGILYENADRAVYASKRRGKNVATLYSVDM